MTRLLEPQPLDLWVISDCLWVDHILENRIMRLPLALEWRLLLLCFWICMQTLLIVLTKWLKFLWISVDWMCVYLAYSVSQRLDWICLCAYVWIRIWIHAVNWLCIEVWVVKIAPVCSGLLCVTDLDWRIRTHVNVVITCVTLNIVNCSARFPHYSPRRLHSVAAQYTPTLSPNRHVENAITECSHLDLPFPSTYTINSPTDPYCLLLLRLFWPHSLLNICL